MIENDKDKLNKIEELKRRLFSNQYETQIDHHDGYTRRHKEDIPDHWEEPVEGVSKKAPQKTTIFKKFFIFSIIFLVLALGYVSYMFFMGGNSVSASNIEISVLGNTFTSGGEELPVQVEVINRNNAALELVDIVLEYPKGSAGEVERLRTSVGSIPAGGIWSESFKIVLFGEQGSVHPIKISLEYRVQNSNAIFLKEKTYEVSINATPINLLVDAPTEITPNQDITLNIKTVLNATRPATNIMVKVEYPVGFQFISSVPSPSLGNNIWELGDLAPGAQSDIKIQGKIVDVFDGEEKTFRVFSGSQSSKDKSQISVIFNSLAHTVAIRKAFIEAKLFINGVYNREYAIDGKTPITGQITWTNNLDTKVNDLSIKAKFTGSAFDRRTVNSQGFYNSLEDTIVWDKNSIPDFAEIESGESGNLGFSVRSLPLLSVGGIISQPVINIEVSITGRQSVQGNELKQLTNSESKVVKIISDVGFATKGIYYSGPFKNTGPIPPKAEVETTYTIVWTLSNTSNNISKAVVRSTLPPWIRFVGAVSPAQADLAYNASTKQLTWNIGGIPRGTGITAPDREISFQVALIPSLSQIGTAPVLVNNTLLTGYDDFANVDVSISRGVISTRLSNDPLFPNSGANVTQ